MAIVVRINNVSPTEVVESNTIERTWEELRIEIEWVIVRIEVVPSILCEAITFYPTILMFCWFVLKIVLSPLHTVYWNEWIRVFYCDGVRIILRFLVVILLLHSSVECYSTLGLDDKAGSDMCIR